MYKSGIVIIGLLTGIHASENPFSIEKNIQKINQEESDLLNILKKEKISDEESEDISSEKSIADVMGASETNTTRKRSSGSAAVLQTKVKPAVKENPKSSPEEPSSTPAANSAKKPPAKEMKKESTKSTPEQNIVKEKTLKEQSKQSNGRKDVPKTAQKEKQQVEKAEVKKTTPQPSALLKESGAVEKEIKVVDSKIKELEERLESVKEKKGAGEPKEATSKDREKESTLDKELQEAIKSVED